MPAKSIHFEARIQWMWPAAFISNAESTDSMINLNVFAADPVDLDFEMNAWRPESSEFGGGISGFEDGNDGFGLRIAGFLI
jgi:hypothetical protein